MVQGLLFPCVLHRSSLKASNLILVFCKINLQIMEIYVGRFSLFINRMNIQCRSIGIRRRSNQKQCRQTKFVVGIKSLSLFNWTN